MSDTRSIKIEKDDAVITRDMLTQARFAAMMAMNRGHVSNETISRDLNRMSVIKNELLNLHLDGSYSEHILVELVDIYNRYLPINWRA